METAGSTADLGLVGKYLKGDKGVATGLLSG